MAEELSKKQQVLQDLKKLILARTSIVYLLSDEEDRVEGLLKELSATFQPRPKLYVWNPFYGLFGENERIEGSVSPVEALDKVIQRNEQTLYLFEGLHPFLKTDLLIARKLKDIHRALRNRYSTVFIIGPSLVLPEELVSGAVLGILQPEQGGCKKCSVDGTGFANGQGGGGKAIFQAFEIVRRFGRVCAIGISGRDEVAIPYDRGIFKALRYDFCFSSSWTAWEKTIGMISKGLLPAEKIISHKLPLEKWEEAFRLLENLQAAKVILIP